MRCALRRIHPAFPTIDGGERNPEPLGKLLLGQVELGADRAEEVGRRAVPIRFDRSRRKLAILVLRDSASVTIAPIDGTPGNRRKVGIGDGEGAATARHRRKRQDRQHRQL